MKYLVIYFEGCHVYYSQVFDNLEEARDFCVGRVGNVYSLEMVQ